MERYSIIDLGNRIVNNVNKEGYRHDSELEPDEMLSLVILFIISITIWIWALYELIQNFSTLPDWVKIIGILGLTMNNIAGGPFLTLFAIYSVKYKIEFCFN